MVAWLEGRDLDKKARTTTITSLATTPLREDEYALPECDSKSLGSHSAADAVLNTGGWGWDDGRGVSMAGWGGSDGILNWPVYLNAVNFSALPIAEAARVTTLTPPNY